MRLQQGNNKDMRGYGFTFNVGLVKWVLVLYLLVVAALSVHVVAHDFSHEQDECQLCLLAHTPVTSTPQAPHFPVITLYQTWRIFSPKSQLPFSSLTPPVRAPPVI